MQYQWSVKYIPQKAIVLGKTANLGLYLQIHVSKLYWDARWLIGWFTQSIIIKQHYLLQITYSKIIEIVYNHIITILDMYAFHHLKVNFMNYHLHYDSLYFTHLNCHNVEHQTLIEKHCQTTTVQYKFKELFNIKNWKFFKIIITSLCNLRKIIINHCLPYITITFALETASKNVGFGFEIHLSIFVSIISSTHRIHS